MFGPTYKFRSNVFSFSIFSSCKKNNTAQRCVKAAFAAAAYIVSPLAHAQITPPTPDPAPARLQIDGNGVDLSDGSLQLTSAAASVGPSSTGLEAFMFHSGDGWRSNQIGSITESGSIYTVSLGRTSEAFQNNAGVYTSQRGSGATLTYSASNTTYTYTSANGAIAKFKKSPTTGYTFQETIPSGTHAYLIETISPNNLVTTYTYTIETVGTGYYRRLQSINNSVGYQLHFTYFNNNTPSNVQWHRVYFITAINNAVDYCSPTANSCSGLTKTWPSITFTYHTSGRLGSVDDALNRRVRYYYNGSNQLTGIRWPSSSSNDITIAYNGAGRVSSVNRGFGTWTYSYSEGGGNRTTTVTNPENETTTVVSQLSTGLVTSVQDGVRTTSYTYDSNQRLKSITQPEGNKVEYTYDARGNVTQSRVIAKPGSGLSDIVTSATYPATCTNQKTCNKPTSTTDAGGYITNYTYSATHGGVTSIKRPAWAGVRPETRYAYASKQARYKNGSSSYVLGSALHVPVETSACARFATCAGGADETKTTINYPSTSTPNNLQPTSTTVAAGNGAVTATTISTYDHNGDLDTIDGPLSGPGDTTRFYYNTARQQTGVIGPDPDAGGPLKFRAVKIDYNSDGMPTSVQTGTTTSQGPLALTIFVSLQKQETVYDNYNRVKETRFYDGAFVELLTQVSYDAAGRIECTAQRMNPSVFTALPSSACSLGASGLYGSDRITKVEYNAAGQPTKTMAAFGTSLVQDSVARTFTPNGLVKTVTDANGNKTTYDYDDFDRLIKTSFPSKTTPGVSSSSDKEEISYFTSGGDKGLVYQVRRRNGGVYTYDYDNLRRLTGISAPPDDATISLTYDNFDRVTQTSRDGASILYAYDQLSRRTIENGQFGVVSYAYDAAGRRTRMTWTDGFYVDYDYDLSGAVTKIRENGATSGPGVLATFAYDDLGRRTSLTRGNGFTTTYGFDGVSRLTSLTHNLSGSTDDQTYGFSYNPASQITERTDTNADWNWAPSAAGTDTYTVNGLNQYLTAAGSSPTYDANGNLQSYDGTTYTYDSANRLSTATPSGGTGVSFDYDPVGRLLKMTTLSGRTYFRYDGDAMIAEYNNAGTIQHRYVHGPGIDEPLVWYEGSGTTNKRWLGADPRGSVTAVTDGNGAKEQINTYGPYGEGDATNLGRFRFTGQMAITEGGVDLYYYKARFYEPNLGRFLQTDPIGYGDGMNMYAYAGSDPRNRRDPSGTQAVDEIIVVQDPGSGGGRNPVDYGIFNDPTGTAGDTFQRDLDTLDQYEDYLECVERGECDVDEIIAIGTPKKSYTLGGVSSAGVALFAAQRILENYRRGKAYEAYAAAYLESLGYAVTREVTFESGIVRARVDIVAYKPSTDTYHFIEVKSGPFSRKTWNQTIVYPAISAGTAVPIGGRAGAAGLPVGQPLAEGINIRYGVAVWQF